MSLATDAAEILPRALPLADHASIAYAADYWSARAQLNERLCWRHLNSDPPCRSNIDPGRIAEFGISNCG